MAVSTARRSDTGRGAALLGLEEHQRRLRGVSGIIFTRDTQPNNVDMKKENKKKEDEQKSKQLNTKNFPEKNNRTDAAKNIASQTPGLNQAKITRDDQFPSDGDDSDV